MEAVNFILCVYSFWRTDDTRFVNTHKQGRELLFSAGERRIIRELQDVNKGSD